MECAEGGDRFWRLLVGGKCYSQSALGGETSFTTLLLLLTPASCALALHYTLHYMFAVIDVSISPCSILLCILAVFAFVAR